MGSRSTSLPSRALYARLGYDDHADPIHPAGPPHDAPGRHDTAPILWPMWRPPGSASAIDPDRSPRPADGAAVTGQGASRVLRWVT